MSRKKFIESQGASCDNWYWSWSFINEKAKTIIFGIWDANLADGLIFSEEWAQRPNGVKPKGYKQSREHIRLVEEEGYQLKTFPMRRKRSDARGDGNRPPKIERIVPTLSSKFLENYGKRWYAVDPIPEEIVTPERYFDGASKKISVNSYERNREAREKCIEHHGYICAVCSFDFEKFYGEIGTNYIHVHHIVPLHEIKEEYEINPVEGLIPMCPNCHAMIHRSQLTVEQLKEELAKRLI
ncbi:MAG: HNH endonuclease [Methylococcales bacterium]|nr:HNH endonuclease [Methylococcales bacterium]